jgi:hypothetical protein
LGKLSYFAYSSPRFVVVDVHQLPPVLIAAALLVLFPFANIDEVFGESKMNKADS